MGSSEEEKHAFPNASRRVYIDVRTGSIYIRRTVTVRPELKLELKKKTDIAITLRRRLMLLIEMAD